MSRAPTAESFWIEDGKLLAGMYAGAETDTETVSNLGALVAAGVTLIVDLSHESDGLPPYAAHVAAPMRRVGMPIRDFDVPTLEQLVETLAVIDSEIEDGGVVFVHCWGGCGRTGTVVSSWLVKHGMTAESALGRYAEACGRKCPERPEQFELVETYAESRT
jgi:hypothetical protein